MPEPTTTTDYNQAIQHCAEAYYRVRAELPQGAYYHADLENQQKAGLAYLTELPILSDPAAFQLYIACIAKGVALGAVDIVDAGRLCHIAQTAMSAWKLANLIVPAAQAKQRAAQKKEELAQQQHTPLPPKGNHFEDQDSQFGPNQPPQDPKQPTPLPPKGNHPDESAVDKAILHALGNLPLFEVQKQHFQSLRNRGIVLPSDPELRDNPLAALHFCQIAERLLREEALADNPPHPQAVSQPATDPQEQPKQVA